MEKNFQKQLLDLASGLCLFDCYMELAGIDNFYDKMFYIQKAMAKNILGPDGYVLDADKLYRNILGQEKTVTKTYTYVGTDNVIACWDHYHFTIVDKDGNMVYDPMGPRENPYKEITSYRVVTNLV